MIPDLFSCGSVGRLTLEIRSGSRNLGVNLVGDVAAVVDVRDESGHHRNDEDEGDETPGELLEQISGLTDAESLVAGGEVACKSASLAVLKQDNDCKQDACKDYKHCKDYE